MRPSEALASKRDAVVETVGRYCVANLRIFGSVARGDGDETSGVDILVDPLPGLTLFQLGGIQSDLETLLGGPVDVRRVLAEAKAP